MQKAGILRFAIAFGMPNMTISRYRKKAIRDGHLMAAKTHSYRSVGKGETTEFQFLDQRLTYTGRDDWGPYSLRLALDDRGYS